MSPARLVFSAELSQAGFELTKAQDWVQLKKSCRSKRSAKDRKQLSALSFQLKTEEPPGFTLIAES
jgi:hypothetical protein